MKKILFLINTLDGGGAEKVLIDIVNNLNLKKYDITVMTLFDYGVYRSQLNNNIKYSSLNKSRNKLIKRLRAYAIQFILPAKLIHKIYIGNKFDIEIAFLEGAPVKIISASKNKDSIKLTWVHTDLDKYYHHLKMFKSVEGNSKAYKKFDKIFCVSQEAKEAFSRRFSISNRVYVQHNILDDHKIKEKSKEVLKYVFPDKFRIISVGRLVNEKGYDRLIECCKQLSIDGVDFELLILGEGSQRLELENLISIYSLHNSVKLLGFQDNPYNYIINCDLFVSSSRVEGYPLVVAEALILGIPVLSTKCTGPNELLNYGEYGMMVENSTEGLYEGLKNIIEDKALYDYFKVQAQVRGRSFIKSERLKEIEMILDGERGVSK